VIEGSLVGYLDLNQGLLPYQGTEPHPVHDLRKRMVTGFLDRSSTPASGTRCRGSGPGAAI
jgi:hypothetical protein